MLFVWYDPLNSNLEETQVENIKCLSQIHKSIPYCVTYGDLHTKQFPVPESTYPYDDVQVTLLVPQKSQCLLME